MRAQPFPIRARGLATSCEPLSRHRVRGVHRLTPHGDVAEARARSDRRSTPSPTTTTPTAEGVQPRGRPVGSWVSPSRSWTSPRPAGTPFRRRGRRLPSRRPTGCARELGATFAHYVRDNILATQRLFEAAGPRGLRIVMASTSSVYGDAETYPTREDTSPRPVSPYGVTKVACEFLARTYSECFGLEVVVLRYFTVYGPRQRPDMAFARSSRPCSTGTRSPCTAPASSHVTSRTWTMPSPPRSPQWKAARA